MNPELAVRIAAAASNVLGRPAVQQAGPADTQTAADIAARILASLLVARLQSPEIAGVNAFITGMQMARTQAGSPFSSGSGSGSAGAGSSSGSGSGGGGGSTR